MATTPRAAPHGPGIAPGYAMKIAACLNGTGLPTRGVGAGAWLVAVGWLALAPVAEAASISARLAVGATILGTCIVPDAPTLAALGGQEAARLLANSCTGARPYGLRLESRETLDPAIPTASEAGSVLTIAY